MAMNQEKGHISERVTSWIEKGDIKGIVDSRLEGSFDINSAWKAVEIAMSLIPNERPVMSVIVVELKEALATELARTNGRGVDPRYSGEPVSVNLDTEFIPLARLSQDLSLVLGPMTSCGCYPGYRPGLSSNYGVDCRWSSKIVLLYNYDVYDRFWDTCDFKQDWTSVVNDSITANSLNQSVYQPPAVVMSTAVTPANASAPLVISWEPQHENDQFYAYLHFTEIQVNLSSSGLSGKIDPSISKLTMLEKL
ncbi:hypothetical protein Fmac_019894 [Flemingia macrophylla]|uniref:Malectin-like domain-containing protein n=1 Tax=Flemingia macrophylla TaxID=520843 RepID=A0ABD1M9U8_9FABA